MNKASLILCAALACVTTSSADAADTPDCGLQLMGGAELTYDEVGRPLVPVTIEGISKRILLDSGGAVTALSPATVDELELDESDAGVRILDLAGNVSGRLAHTDEFIVGNLNAGYYRFMVLPERSRVLTDEAIGLLALDFFLDFDIEFDFGSDLFLVFSQDHCEGMVTHWSPPSVAVVPFDLDQTQHITFPVLLDGNELLAVLDTGAAYTSLDMEVAKELFGLKYLLDGVEVEIVEEDLDEEEIGDAEIIEDAEFEILIDHEFSSLSFEGITIPNPKISPVPMARFYRTWYQRRIHPDSKFIIGMDVLKLLHIYVAIEEEKLYISSASTPASAVPTNMENAASGEILTE